MKVEIYHDNGVMLLDGGGLADGILEFQDELLDGLLVLNRFADNLLEIVLGRLSRLLLAEGNHLRKIPRKEFVTG